MILSFSGVNRAFVYLVTRNMLILYHKWYHIVPQKPNFAYLLVSLVPIVFNDIGLTIEFNLTDCQDGPVLQS